MANAALSAESLRSGILTATILQKAPWPRMYAFMRLSTHQCNDVARHHNLAIAAAQAAGMPHHGLVIIFSRRPLVQSPKPPAFKSPATKDKRCASNAEQLYSANYQQMGTALISVSMALAAANNVHQEPAWNEWSRSKSLPGSSRDASALGPRHFVLEYRGFPVLLKWSRTAQDPENGAACVDRTRFNTGRNCADWWIFFRSRQIATPSVSRRSSTETAVTHDMGNFVAKYSAQPVSVKRDRRQLARNHGAKL